MTKISGHEFDLRAADIADAVRHADPEPIREHYVVVDGRRYPPKQVLAAVTGLDRADFTTHQARAVLRRLGFGVYRRGRAPATGHDAAIATPAAAEAAALAPYAGRWVAQVGHEVVFDSDSPDAVVRWLRRHGRHARVWRIPSSPGEAGSTQSTP